MNSEKVNKEDALKKVVKVEAERDAAVKAYVPHTDATHIYLHVSCISIHPDRRLPCISVSN
jgi:ribosomal protein S12